MRLVWLGEPPEPPRLGPMGYNHASKRRVGVELDQGTIVDTGIELGSLGISDYSSCYSSQDRAELARGADGWIIRVVNESGEVTGPLDVSVTAVYVSVDGKAWRKVDAAPGSTDEPLSRLG